MLKYFAAFNVVLYFTYAYLYFFENFIVPIKPVEWYLASLIIGFILLAFKRQIKVKNTSSRNMIMWAMVFIIISSISYVLTLHSAGLQVLIQWCEAALILILFVFLFQDEETVRYSAVALLLAVIVSVLINYYDFIYPGMFSKDPGRAAGMYVNSNISGSMLVFGMVSSVWVINKKFRVLFCLFVFTGVVITFSRASIMMWAIAAIFLTWKEAFHLPKVPSTIGLSAVILVMGLLLVTGGWLTIFKTVGLDSYLSDNAKNRIGGSFVSQKDNSSKIRRYLVVRSLDLFSESPIIGHGLGSTEKGDTKIGTHNLYLRLAVNLGIIGVVLVLSFIWIIWQAKSNFSSNMAVLYAFSGIFTHNHFDHPAKQVCIALALVGVYLYPNNTDSEDDIKQIKQTDRSKRILNFKK